MLNSFVKNIFTLLMGVVAAVLLYFAFFGFNPANDDYYNGTEWRGALWYVAESLETPISRYYFEYCFLPSVHSDKAVDMALGGTDKYPDIQKTNTDLSSDTSDSFSFASGPHISYYSTGWQ